MTVRDGVADRVSRWSPDRFISLPGAAHRIARAAPLASPRRVIRSDVCALLVRGCDVDRSLRADADARRVGIAIGIGGSRRRSRLSASPQNARSVALDELNVLSRN